MDILSELNSLQKWYDKIDFLSLYKLKKISNFINNNRLRVYLVDYSRVEPVYSDYILLVDAELKLPIRQNELCFEIESNYTKPVFFVKNGEHEVMCGSIRYVGSGFEVCTNVHALVSVHIEIEPDNTMIKSK